MNTLHKINLRYIMIQKIKNNRTLASFKNPVKTRPQRLKLQFPLAGAGKGNL